MSKMKFKMKGPVGAIVGIIAIAVFAYMEFLMPLSLSSKDKKAILEKVENIRLAKMSEISSATMTEYKNSGKFNNDTDKLKDLSGDVAISKIEGKNGFFSGTKIKVTYTIAGKSPKFDGGVLYLKLYRRGRRRSGERQRFELAQISKGAYDASFFGSSKEKPNEKGKRRPVGD